MTGAFASCVRELLAGPKFGTGIGFRRMQLILRPLMESTWGRDFTTIRVTGSNGKGSVSAIVHSILRSLGVNCGRYTSPHLVRLNERIVIGDREATDAEIVAAFSWVKQAISEIQPELHGDEFGSFELMTLLCMRIFHETGVRVGV